MPTTNNSCDYSPLQYNVQTGGPSGTLNNVTPSATSGIPVISQGSATQPTFGTAVVAGGGTGRVSSTAYAVICGGTASTTPQQSVASVGTSGQILTSNGALTLPTFQNAGASSISITGDSGGALTGAAFTFTGGTTGLTFAGAGSTETLGGTLAIANGGTNATSMTNTDGVVYYDGTRLVTTAVGSATQVLTSNGAGVAPTFQTAGSGGITTINGNTGSVTGSTVTVKVSGGSSVFTGSGTTLSQTFSDASFNTILADNSNYASVTGFENTGIGYDIFTALTSGNYNTAIGFGALENIAGGSSNTGLGAQSIDGVTSGSFNIGIGRGSGANYSTSESSNIVIGYNAIGITNESNVLRIGSATGTGSGQLNSAFISGINGNTVSNTRMVTINSSTDQLGTAALPGAGALTLIQTQTAASLAAVNFTTGISSTYDNYLLLVGNGVIEAAAFTAQALLVRISTNGGSTYISTGYASTGGVTSGFVIAYTLNSGSTTECSGSFILSNLTAATNTPSSSGAAVIYDTTIGLNSGVVSGIYPAGSVAVNALQVVMTDGSNFSGIFSLYGYSK